MLLGALENFNNITTVEKKTQKKPNVEAKFFIPDQSKEIIHESELKTIHSSVSEHNLIRSIIQLTKKGK